MIHKPLEPFMRNWDIVRCSDHHFQRAIYGLGLHIADYPEQSAAAGTVYGWCVTLVTFSVLRGNNLLTSQGVTLTLMISTTPMRTSGPEKKPPPSSGTRTMTHCGMIMDLFQTSTYVLVALIFLAQLSLESQPFTMRFPRADIYELLTPDLLHQAIKGTFKDHLVQWVEDYLKISHGSSKAEGMLDEIDRRYANSRICQHAPHFLQHRTRASFSWSPAVQTRPQL